MSVSLTIGSAAIVVTCTMHVAIPEGEGCPSEQFLTVLEPLIYAVEADVVVTICVLSNVSVVVLEDFFDVLDGSDFFHFGWFVFDLTIIITQFGAVVYPFVSLYQLSTGCGCHHLLSNPLNQWDCN